MESHQSTRCIIIVIFMSLFFFSISSTAQVEVLNGIQYKQISTFETDLSIMAVKISGDGTKIVFATGGPAVKVYTIDSDGTDLAEVYDFQRTGNGPMVDISVNGDKVIWCDGEGEIYIANSDGSNRLELATLLPNPPCSRCSSAVTIAPVSAAAWMTAPSSKGFRVGILNTRHSIA